MGAGRECEQAREELSARLDGEDSVELRPQVDAHLRECAACTAWWERAGAVTRLVRTSAALPGAGLSEQAMTAVLAAAPSRKPWKLANVLRLALLVIGLGQFLLGVAQISNLAGALGEHTHDEPAGIVTSGHLWHESAAWNVAIGAALAWLAWRRTHPAALLPVMTAFVIVLALLTANDALIGQVEAGRILSHGLILGGYALLLVLNRPGFRGLQPPAATARPGSGGWSTGDGDDGGGPLAPVYPFPVRAAATGRAVTVQSRRTA